MLFIQRFLNFGKNLEFYKFRYSWEYSARMIFRFLTVRLRFFFIPMKIFFLSQWKMKDIVTLIQVVLTYMDNQPTKQTNKKGFFVTHSKFR